MKSASFYNAIYSFKDYKRESEQLLSLIAEHKKSNGMKLLDVACGTGQHITFLREQFVVEGLDLDVELLNMAREQHPDLTFHHADMTNFALGKPFDIVTCLFSSIGYVKTPLRLRQAIQNMSHHTRVGGLVIVEPWFSHKDFKPGGAHALFVDQPNLKIARMNVSQIEEDVSVLEFHYLIATPEGVEYTTERHELGLFSHEDYCAAFRASGMKVSYDNQGLMGRGLYIGIKL